MTTNARCVMPAVAAAALLLNAGCRHAETAPAPLPTVYVTPVIQQDVPVYLDLVGQTRGSQDVEIRARVEGFLESMRFVEGSFVRMGDPLYEIDRKPLEAIVAAARADQATAEARLAKATNDVARYTPLVAKQAVSQRELDDARAEQDAARSQVDAARAAADKATLDLSYTHITAPISGLVGQTLVKPGNLVGRGENTLLTTISRVDPLLFRVAASEADYLRYIKRQAAQADRAAVASDIPLTLADGSVYAHTGRVSTVDRAVDPTTGTLGLELTFPNPELLLRPGQYGRARLLLETIKNALLVPQRAVQELQSIYSVAVVDTAGTVAFRTVTVGPRVESLWVIQDGLRPGERVVVEGLQRVQDGMLVRAETAPPPDEDEPPATPAGKAG